MFLVNRSDVHDLAEVERPWSSGEAIRWIRLKADGWGCLRRQDVSGATADRWPATHVPFCVIYNHAELVNNLVRDEETAKKHLSALQAGKEGNTPQPTTVFAGEYAPSWHTAYLNAKKDKRWQSLILNIVDTLIFHLGDNPSNFYVSEFRRKALIEYWSGEVEYIIHTRNYVNRGIPLAETTSPADQQPHGSTYDEGTI